jgi:hypothetical protein
MQEGIGGNQILLCTVAHLVCHLQDLLKGSGLLKSFDDFGEMLMLLEDQRLPIFKLL